MLYESLLFLFLLHFVTNVKQMFGTIKVTINHKWKGCCIMMQIDFRPNHAGVNLVQVVSDQTYPETVGFFDDTRFKFDVTENHLNDDGLTLIWFSNELSNHQLSNKHAIDIVEDEVAKDRLMRVVGSEIWFNYPIRLDLVESHMKQLISRLNHRIIELKDKY